MTALSYAAEKGNEAAVQLLLERKADVNAKDFDGSTALHWAALNGHEFAVRLLLERHDTDVNAQLFGHDPECDLAGDSWGGWMGGWIPLHMAAGKGHEAVVRLLMEHH